VSFSRYNQYKDSGVRWLGKIPAHWEAKKLRHLASRISSGKTPLGGSETYVDEGVVFLRSQNVYDEGLRLDEVVYIAKETDARMAASRIKPGDVLLNITGASLGRSCIVPKDFSPANVNQHVCAVRLRDAEQASYVSWCLKSTALKMQMDFAQDGAAREGLNFEQIGRMSIAVPPSAEREKIASFLERETAKIDALVTEQNRLIELLKEKRLAVAAHAVTKGLKDDAPTKDSGVDWLGFVPAHWRILRNKAIFREVDERTMSEEGELLTVSHLTGVTPRSEKNVNMFMAETLEGYKKCETGDLVINTMWAWMGALGIAPCYGLVSPSYNVYRLRARDTLDPAFYECLCRIPVHVAMIRGHSTGVWESRLRLYPEVFLDLRTAVPPIEEQAAIVSFLERETVRLDALMAEAVAATALLKERRAALISAVVTGKIDVRGLAAVEAEKVVAA
jgi:type I restriction enzyme S subunit